MRGSAGLWNWSSANSPRWGACVRCCFGSGRRSARAALFGTGAGSWPGEGAFARYSTIHKTLCNPIYAGAYAFGRTGTRTRVVDGRAHKTRGHLREREEWIVLLHDHHEGYIDWDTYERNRRLIAENAQMKGVMVRGAARERPQFARGTFALWTLRKKASRCLLR